MSKSAKYHPTTTKSKIFNMGTFINKGNEGFRRALNGVILAISHTTKARASATFQIKRFAWK